LGHLSQKKKRKRSEGVKMKLEIMQTKDNSIAEQNELEAAR